MWRQPLHLCGLGGRLFVCSAVDLSPSLAIKPELRNFLCRPEEAAQRARHTEELLHRPMTGRIGGGQLREVAFMAANDSKDLEHQSLFSLWMKFPFNQRLTGMDEMMKSLFLHEFLCSQLSSEAVNKAWTQESPLLRAKKGSTRRSVRANWSLLIQLHETKPSPQTSSAAIHPKIKGADIIVKNLRKEWRKRESRGFF